MFGLAFVVKVVVKVVVRYNPIIHKTQPQKLIFLVFYSFLVDPILKPQPPPLTQIPSKPDKGNPMWSIAAHIDAPCHQKIG
jgi:hypothetical protein